MCRAQRRKAHRIIPQPIHRKRVWPGNLFDDGTKKSPFGAFGISFFSGGQSEDYFLVLQAVALEVALGYVIYGEVSFFVQDDFGISHFRRFAAPPFGDKMRKMALSAGKKKYFFCDRNGKNDNTIVRYTPQACQL